MILIIAGSRDIQDRETVFHTISNNPFTITRVDEVVTGGASGVDALAKEYVQQTHHGIDHTEMQADWDQHGRAAGPIRNQQMAEYADALLAIWDGESSGTRNMIENALEQNLDMHVKVVNSDG